MKSQVRAIRWVSFESNFNCAPEDINVDSLSYAECLNWEMNPTRELSIEIIRWKTHRTFCNMMGCYGLEIDQSLTELVRIYAKDGNTIPDENGRLWSCDSEILNSSGWENARTIYDSVPHRETWAEGVIKNPKYKAVIYREDDQASDLETALWIAKHLGNLPIKRMKTRACQELPQFGDSFNE